MMLKFHTIFEDRNIWFSKKKTSSSINYVLKNAIGIAQKILGPISGKMERSAQMYDMLQFSNEISQMVTILRNRVLEDDINTRRDALNKISEAMIDQAHILQKELNAEANILANRLTESRMLPRDCFGIIAQYLFT